MPEEDIYRRQNLIEGLSSIRTATVVGCGGTGFWTAIFLAMSGVKEIILIDPDTIEQSNRNRLPVGNDVIGQHKVDVLCDWIHSIRPETHIEPHITVINDENVSIVRGSVFCCTDNLRSQQLLCAYSRKNHLQYQRIGYDGVMLNVSRAFPLTFKDNLDEGGYTETPSWVVPAVAASVLGIYSQMKSEVVVMDDMGTICSKESSFIPETLRSNIEEGALHRLKEDGWGDCDACDEKKDCDDCNHCENCERYTEVSYDEMKEDLEEKIESLKADNEGLIDEKSELITRLKEADKEINELRRR